MILLKLGSEDHLASSRDSANDFDDSKCIVYPYFSSNF